MGKASGSSEEAYGKNEKVLCSHIGLFFPAKIVEVRDPSAASKKRGGGDEAPKPFKVHYDGWNKRYDEWVPLDRLQKATAENIEKAEEERRAKEARDEESGGKGKERRKRDGSPSSNPSKASVASSVSKKAEEERRAKEARDEESGGKGKERRKRDGSPSSNPSKASVASSVSKKARPSSGASASVESAKEYAQRPEIPISIPKALKDALVEDWDLVTRQMKIPPPDVDLTVDQLVDLYVKEKRADSSITALEREQFEENALGVRDHFNVMLGAQLLYKLERPAYAAWREKVEEGTKKEDADDGPKASAHYGWIHLVRLFVRIGTLLAFTNWSPSNVELITGHLHDFLRFLQGRKDQAFRQAAYHTTTPEYQKNAWL